ncbi:MAG: NADH-quinone oxidoreductase subunit NuoE [Nitrospirota bacterium]
MPEIAKERIEELKARVASMEHPDEALVDLMHEVQAGLGYLSDEGVELVARIAGVNPMKVEQLATFYNLIYRRPVGRKVIHVCDSISCWVVGADDIFEYLKNKLGVELGGTTIDGAFTLLPICCLGACHVAPAMMIGEKLYGDLTPEKIDRILEQERI